MPNLRSTIDAAAGGTLNNKSPEEAFDLLEEMAANSYQWPIERLSARKLSGIHEIDSVLKIQGPTCEFCNGSHASTECRVGNPFTHPPENTNFVGNFSGLPNNPYSNTYNPGWRNHPNFSWSNQNQQGPRPPPPSFRPPEEKQHNHLEEMVTKLAQTTQDFIKSADVRFQNREASIRNRRSEVGRLANHLSERPYGTLPSNMRRIQVENAKAITLRSGKEVSRNLSNESTRKKKEIEPPGADAPEIEPSKADPPRSKLFPDNPKPYVPPVPYPERLQQHKIDKQFSKFLDVFKKLHINIPFADALAQMPSYAKFLKEILANKQKLEDYETVKLNEECASINLMPYSVFRKLGLGEAKATTVSLQLADRSIKYPRGIVEDVLVKVDKFIFPADFIVLEIEEDFEVSIILGRPFLATGRALIDVQQGKLILRVQDDRVTFDVFKAMKYLLSRMNV
ncbi:uncharacterized protein LOC115663395 [Syzygium oleosum]|uniref:uncharacterized protein LOC115663395 n=1 Tax=Syzygium oleosum TaxID=219896 RepID=UPI0024BB375E|nr:uncharacterized protein LOC115663395 [Syzygium oleosum]